MWRYRHTKGSDGDIQSLLYYALGKMRKHSNFSYTSKWVKSHQDKLDNLLSLPREVALNVRMDWDTKAAYNLPAQWQSCNFVPVLHAEGCAVYIGNRKITSYIHTTLLEQWHEKEAKAYLQQRHQISTGLFPHIQWRAIRFSLKKLSPHRKATAIKTIHRHIPTNEKLFQQGRTTMTSICPRCVQATETHSHIFCCPNDDALKQRKTDWLALWKNLHKARTSTVIEQAWRYHMQPLLGISLGESIVDGLIPAHGEVATLLERAIQDQSEIGWDKLLVGMGSTIWKSLQDFIDSNNPKRPQRSATDWMNTAVYQLLKFSIRCWKDRNRKVHGETRQEQKAIALQKARDKITDI
mmetsp:Transcript_1672/g.2560  ORF Transcript_1672/g.2560 Transcript_1672/m.2560 type:complete len:352 (+) Transcript_1672:862-1917(+)